MVDMDPHFGTTCLETCPALAVHFQLTAPPRIQFGSPVSRDRVYVLFVLKSLMTGAAKSDFHKFATELIEKCAMPATCSWHLDQNKAEKQVTKNEQTH